MIKIFFGFLVLLTLTFCTSKKITKILWQGELVTKSDEITYLYWNDGNQFLTQKKDSITMSIAGFEFENVIYVLLSLENEKKLPITFFTKQSKLLYEFENEKIELQSIRPKNLDKSHFSFFNTLIGGAGRISSMFLNIPVDMLFNTDNTETNTHEEIGGDYHDENINMTKKLFMNNHTLFPGTNYAGFLVFEYDPDKDIKNGSFTFEILIETIFQAQGNLIN